MDTGRNVAGRMIGRMVYGLRKTGQIRGLVEITVAVSVAGDYKATRVAFCGPEGKEIDGFTHVGPSVPDISAVVRRHWPQARRECGRADGRDLVYRIVGDQ